MPYIVWGENKWVWIGVSSGFPYKVRQSPRSQSHLLDVEAVMFHWLIDYALVALTDAKVDSPLNKPRQRHICVGVSGNGD